MLKVQFRDVTYTQCCAAITTGRPSPGRVRFCKTEAPSPGNTHFQPLSPPRGPPVLLPVSANVTRRGDLVGEDPHGTCPAVKGLFRGAQRPPGSSMVQHTVGLLPRGRSPGPLHGPDMSRAHPPISGRWGGPHALAVVSNAAMSVGLRAPLQDPACTSS